MEKNNLKDSFPNEKKYFITELASHCEFDLRRRNVPQEVINSMKGGRLPQGFGYDIEHMKDRSLGRLNDHANLVFVDRSYNAAKADLTVLQTRYMMPGTLRTIYEPVPRAYYERRYAPQIGTES